MSSRAATFWTFLASSVVLTLAACTGASNPLGGGGTQNCQQVPCGNGDSINECVSQPSGGCSDITYQVGGQTFSCNSCQGCGQAQQQATTACINGSGSSSGGGSGSSSGGGSGSSSGSGGGTTTCSGTASCGTSGITYASCTTVENGACTGMAYRTSTGQTFHCNGCTNCATAAQELTSYCDGAADGGGGQTTCGSALSCGNTGYTYQQCTTLTNGACTGIAYQVSNGLTYQCNGCNDCSAALQQVASYCQNTTPTTSCTSWTTCGTSSLSYESCTTSAGGACQAMYYETSDSQTFSCNTCSDCSAAVTNMEAHCTAQTTTTSCGSATACGSTGVTYQLCETSTGGTCQSEYYSTTDGHTYTCSGCDCTTASATLGTYCASLGSFACGTGTCTSGQLCCNCSGTEECLSSNGGTYTCSSYGCQ